MAFGTLAHGLAKAGIIDSAKAEERDHEIAKREALDAREARREAGKRIEARRKARRAEAKVARAEAVARITAEDRERFERAQRRVDADEIVRVEGVWVWRTGRHTGKPVGRKALVKRGIAPGR